MPKMTDSGMALVISLFVCASVHRNPPKYCPKTFRLWACPPTVYRKVREIRCK